MAKSWKSGVTGVAGVQELQNGSSLMAFSFLVRNNLDLRPKGWCYKRGIDERFGWFVSLRGTVGLPIRQAI